MFSVLKTVQKYLDHLCCGLGHNTYYFWVRIPQEKENTYKRKQFIAWTNLSSAITFQTSCENMKIMQKGNNWQTRCLLYFL